MENVQELQAQLKSAQEHIAYLEEQFRKFSPVQIQFMYPEPGSLPTFDKQEAGVIAKTPDVVEKPVEV